ncbi:tyrosine-type recombinase/integrase [Bifidobacterium longum]|uniref:tyrosine-type recombinase/integrase n=1 Tax=Bifidobacterium longum TaxID=216816 RepID=UPI0012ABEAC7|nr:site-specific integrase [Bifidobacterium longum]
MAPITLRKPSARRNQTPLTKDKIDRLVPLPPPNTTGPVHPAESAGRGLRIGEICGLRLRDIDLDHGLLYVRHSVDHGPAVLGSYQLANLQDTIAKLRKRPKISLENSITVDS